MPQRVAIFLVCLVSLLACCGLAWWQWERFESASGTFQNLGYVLQWPLFGLFPAFMFWRIRRLRRQAEAQDQAETTSARTEWGHAPVDVPAPRPDQPRPVRPSEPDGLDDEDAELAAYNRYLAELHARDQKNR
nr:hypothetical protein [Amycolatopsis anabasis]